MRKPNKQIRFIMLLILILICGNITNTPDQTFAAELPQDESNRKVFDVNILQLEENLAEGMLYIPENVQRQIILYGWIMEALEQYMSETGIEDVFFCDLENDVLYGDQEFCLMEMQKTAWDKYEYPIQNTTGIDMKQESYKLMLQGTEHILYMDVNIKVGNIYIYPQESGVAMQTKGGNAAAYDLIERDENGQIVSYPDIYVESDWNDLACADGHFAEVSLDELEELSFLKVPENAAEWLPQYYLNVASVLKRYVEENQIEDVFYFDVEQDVISRVTNMIYTCRIRGNTMTLYIDIDGYNMKAHVYQVEE